MRYYNFEVEGFGFVIGSYRKSFLIQTNANLETRCYQAHEDWPNDLCYILSKIPEVCGSFHTVIVSIPDIRTIPVSMD